MCDKLKSQVGKGPAGTMGLGLTGPCCIRSRLADGAPQCTSSGSVAPLPEHPFPLSCRLYPLLPPISSFPSPRSLRCCASKRPPCMWAGSGPGRCRYHQQHAYSKAARRPPGTAFSAGQLPGPAVNLPEDSALLLEAGMVVRCSWNCPLRPARPAQTLAHFRICASSVKPYPFPPTQ